ncbi:hypothetical protein [Flavobacterium sp. GT3R68]|uniref:HYC_CC_PP family protein n=1 Tax=Flavobacterium sp. GT3R68 TaxID=2594437 RepID=UPI000F877A31|nr:hypothetical protein [Flavobacterium sp. GT3R68]RTY90929.1 hypothetical protein EKL32_19920 [Flavobacterium sp. GSN2]TRW90492.1 hypothetical protein FNW07_10700 [Flavobacterium sp. GT3R68]
MNFRKHLSVIIAFFLLVSNVGMALNVHYCGDEIASVSLKTSIYAADYEKDCCGVVEKRSNCCNDRVVQFQKKIDHSVFKAFSSDSVFTFIAAEWHPVMFTTLFNFKNDPAASYYCDANAPPFFQLYHQYIFYA